MAGRVLVRREGGLEARLVDLKRDVALIPRVAIHLNRETNSGVKYDPARDLVAPVRRRNRQRRFYREVARTADCAPEDVVAGDLVLYNNQPGTVWGAEGEFVSAPPAGRPGLCVCLHRGLSDGAGAGHGAGAVRV